MKVRNHLLSMILAVAACKSTEDPGGGSGRVDGGPRRGRDCKVDRNNKPEEAVALTLGQRLMDETYVCPQTDVDWYSFQLPVGQPLLTVQLTFPIGSTSPVELAYDIFAASDTTTPITGGRDEVPGDNRSMLTRVHALDGAGGAYLLQVRDVGSDEQDTRNQYAITLTAAADPDPSEPNNTCATATPLTGTLTGVIGADGDRDAYRFDVPAGSRIVQVRLTTQQAGEVDFSTTLYSGDGATLIGTAADTFGEDGPTDLLFRQGLDSAGGSHCLIVADDDGQDANPTLSYQLTLSVEDEPDPNEQTVRNDDPSTATDLGSGGTRAGVIASNADLDWYRIGTRLGQIVEVDVQCPGCTIQPAIAIMYGHPESPCTPGDRCQFLNENGSCRTDSDCRSGVCGDTPMGKKCAMRCGENLDCPGFECNRTGAISACVAIGSCTAEGLCGVQQFTATAEETSVRTAQPARATTTYLLVHDFGDDAFTSAQYNLQVTVTDEPDVSEPNNFYAPYTTFEASAVLSRGRETATPVSWRRIDGAVPRAEVGSGGCISYPGDIDIFRIQGGNPCAIATSSTGMPMGEGHCGLQLRYDRPPAGFELSYFLQNRRGRTRASFSSADEGNETVFGDAVCGSGDRECMFVYADDEGDYFLVIRDFGQDDWSTAASDCYTWTLTSAPMFGCPASCPTPHPNDGLCDCMP